jgi:hypothetical protein
MAPIPSFPLPQASVDRLVAAAKDLAYTAIGFGVLGFQQAQVRRRELEKALGCPRSRTDQAK